MFQGSTNNELADALSRNVHSCSSLLQAHSMEIQPTSVPADALTLLLNTHLDWLSLTWITLFISIPSRVSVHPPTAHTPLESLGIFRSSAFYNA